MNNLEELAVLTALKKTIDDRLKEVRAEADDEMREAYEDDGIEKRALKVGDQKVGTFLVVQTKDDYAITDKAAFDEFALCNGFGEMVDEIKPECMYEATQIIKEEHPDLIESQIKYGDWKQWAEPLGDAVVIANTSIVIPGVEYVPPRFKNTQVRDCKPAVVLPIIQKLGGVDRLLLGGGDD